MQIERSTSSAAWAAPSKLFSSSPIDLSSVPSAVSGAGRGMRPSLGVDLMNRVEQDDVLHVGERREARGYERDALARILRGKASAAGAVAIDVLDDQLGTGEILDQLLDGCFDLTVIRLIPVFKLEHDALGCVAAFKSVPHLDRSCLQTEVVTAREVDDDRLAAHSLRDHLRAVHPIPHRPTPLVFCAFFAITRTP